MADETYIQIKCDDPFVIADWRIEILDPLGNTFTVLSGTKIPEPAIRWNGRSGSGEVVQAFSEYTLLINVKDVFGNKDQLYEKLFVGAIVTKRAGDFLIRISSISFAPYSADYVKVDRTSAEKNIRIIGLLAAELKKYSGYYIRIESHALLVNWQDTKEAEQEQATILFPLSRQRAEILKRDLIKRGIPEFSLSSYGFGALQPIIPSSDLINRWKNRRFDIILTKM
jgi:hypothetical protein